MGNVKWGSAAWYALKVAQNGSAALAKHRYGMHDLELTIDYVRKMAHAGANANG